MRTSIFVTESESNPDGSVPLRFVSSFRHDIKDYLSKVQAEVKFYRDHGYQVVVFDGYDGYIW